MSPDLQTALIAGGVSLVTASLTGLVAWVQIRRDSAKWLYDIKTSVSVELYRARMAEYAKLSEILIGLSTRNQPKLTVVKAHAIGAVINEWMYGAGGLVASARTRNAGWALRDRLYRWKSGAQPKDILEVRRLLMWSMRADLDISSGRAEDTAEASLIQRLQEEMEGAVKT